MYEGQATEYGRARFWYPDPVHGTEEDKYHRARTGEQGDAPLGDRLQPQKVPEIREQTPEKWGRKTCPAIIRKNHGPLREKHFSGARKIHVQLLA